MNKIEDELFRFLDWCVDHPWIGLGVLAILLAMLVAWMGLIG